MPAAKRIEKFSISVPCHESGFVAASSPSASPRFGVVKISSEGMFGVKVRLEIWVKVEQNWMENGRLLAEMGYRGALV